jgi:hypothetical protein
VVVYELKGNPSALIVWAQCNGPAPEATRQQETLNSKDVVYKSIGEQLYVQVKIEVIGLDEKASHLQRKLISI